MVAWRRSEIIPKWQLKLACFKGKPLFATVRLEKLLQGSTFWPFHELNLEGFKDNTI